LCPGSVLLKFTQIILLLSGERAKGGGEVYQVTYEIIY
jgi:hypothetical protein